MRGHIRQRNKSWAIVIEAEKGPDGKRHQEWITFKGTYHEAEKKLIEILRAKDTGTYVKPGKTTLAEYLHEWLASIKGSLSPRTIEGYEQIISRIIPKLGNIPLVQLKPAALQRYYSDCLSNGRVVRAGGLSPQTVRHHHTMLHRALKTATEW